MVNTSVYYGNLQSYKFYVRPTAHRLYGSVDTSEKTNHQKMVQRLLKILALKGASTTWEMAKIVFPDNLSKVKTREKEYRRIFLGRTDKGKHSPGLLDLGLIIPEKKVYKNNENSSYRLSLHGILYCIDAFDLSNSEVDQIATTYAKTLPRVFGKWSELKKIFGDDVYKLRLLANGLLLDNPELGKNSKYPIYELMDFLNTLYRKNYDYISEQDLANQISYWFYCSLLYTKLKSSKNYAKIRLKKIFKTDKELQKWFFEFVTKSKQYHTNRLSNLDILLNNF